MKWTSFGGWLLLIFFTGCNVGIREEKITTGSLLSELVELERLTYLPDNQYKTIQYSSYDRRSTVPGQPGWFQNSDGFGNEPIAGFEEILTSPDSTGIGRFLICDIENPGVIVRSWTAMINGTLKVWIDEMADPVYNGPAEDFIWNKASALSGGDNPEQYEEIFRQNDACYFPVAFSKRLRIEWIGDIKQLHFYQIQIRNYKKGTRIRSFTKEDLHEFSEQINSVGSLFSDPYSNYMLPAGQSEENITTLEPGETGEIINLKGQGQIVSLKIRIGSENIDKALRQTLLNIYFDGASIPQVHSPLGDFFSAAPGINPLQSLPFSILPDGYMICRFPMPYRDSVTVIIENHSDSPIKIEYSFMNSSYDWIENKSLHFHAKWRIDHDLLASNKEVQDIPYIIALGKGRFVGVSAYILNPSSVPSSWGNWWGEGDEKIFVDDDISPSTFGTGSEDYFNYSWSSSSLFDHPYCGQPRNDGPANRGFVTNYRFQIIDDIPFSQHFAFFMELLHHGTVDDLSYGRIAYYYATPESVDDNMRINEKDIREQALPYWEKPTGYLGSANSQFFESEDVLTVYPADRLFSGDLWSGGRIIYYEFSKKGEVLPLRVPVESEGNIRVNLTMAHTPESGNVKIYLEGYEGEIELDVDLLSKYAVVSRNHSLARVHLTPGTERIIIENMEDGPNRVGIDFIWVQY